MSSKKFLFEVFKMNDNVKKQFWRKEIDKRKQ